MTWEPQLTVSKMGVVKLGAALVSSRDLPPLQSIIVDTVIALQWELISHTVWLMHETIHLIRRSDKAHFAAHWSEIDILREYCKDEQDEFA